LGCVLGTASTRILTNAKNVSSLVNLRRPKMEKIFMAKINAEIDRLAKKYGSNNEVVAYNLEYDLNAFSVLVIQEYRKAMNEKEPYSLPDEVAHG
jgi:hypothetical protein